MVIQDLVGRVEKTLSKILNMLLGPFRNESCGFGRRSSICLGGGYM